MDDPIFKQKYEKYKLRVKIWEKDFKKKYARVPSKYDIREAPREIRDSYKMYYKLKTSFLENTLNDVLAEDGFDVFEMSLAEDGVTPLDDSLTESVNGGPHLPLDISTIVDANNEPFSNLSELPTHNAHTQIMNLNENHIIKSFESVEEHAMNNDAWGSSVSKKPMNTSQTPNIQNPPIKSQLNQKLFQSSSFSKRNPRKSLSRNSSNVSVKSNSSDGLNQIAQREVLPDLETILKQKAKEHQAAAAIAANPLLSVDKSNDAIKTHVDEGWLNRNAAQNNIKNVVKLNSHQKKSEQNNTATPDRKSSYGLSNIDVSKFTTKQAFNETNVEPILESIEQQLHEESMSTKLPELIPNFVPMPTSSKRAATESNSDSVISDSEDEQQTQVRHIVKRRRIVAEPSEQPVVPSEIHDKSNELKVEEQIESENNANTSDLGKDFSVDEDEEYVPAESKKNKRKKATAKRSKAAAKKEAGEKKERKPRESKPNVERKPRVPKVSKASTVKSRTRGAKQKIEIVEEEPEEKPLDPEDLKYALALDQGDITCIPRIKLADLERVDNVAQRYINTIETIAVTNQKPSAPINEKRAAARQKLEAKIASGKLNENFVTINIQKKKFSRGKQNVNFSQYKKQQWKNRKRISALSGPNMNMGGCDGGVLTCFTCGNVGHFAQNCKMKGDSLLPLTAQLEEEPSEFPTLEEAERMASQSAVAVHSRNISKLPAAPNAAIYQKEDSEKQNTEDLMHLNDSNQNDKVSHHDDGSASDSNGANSDEDNIVFNETDDDDEMDGVNFAEIDAAVAASALVNHQSPIKKYIGHQIPEDFLKKAGLDSADFASGGTQFSGVRPLYDLNDDGTVKEVTPEVLEALHMFGHTNFRKGQDRAIMRILSGLSTLVTLSTGSGKSLCYQLPAYLYSRHKKSITLVISPLVSLMEDQVTGVPHFLRAQCLHTNQTPQQRMKILQMISDGELDILLVSPEAVVSGERSTGFGSILRQLPKIAFACIDEAHCVSQWSHNFRPSYLMICKVLKKNLGVRTVLGLTATATLPTRMSIINHLGIIDGERGIISDIPLPDNLILSISKDANRDMALLELLNSPRFEECQSIIIYCTRRDECERIATFLRTCMQDRKSKIPDTGKKRKRVNWHAEPYHAGMAASRRRTIQNAFMKNELRIVVATIAFGMGINKPDIRAVIHYNMPRNFESYVQEVGRAGRDGHVAHCHLFLDANGNDQNELRRHIYANSIDRHVIRKFLQRIFVPCSCDNKSERSKIAKSIKNSVESDENAKKMNVDASDFSENIQARPHICPGHEIGFSVEQTVEALDIPAENISTLMCYMELDTRWCMNVLSSAYIKAKVISYGGSKYLKHAAKDCAPLAMAIALNIKNGTFKDDANIIEFSVVDIAAAIGWNSGVVKYQLKNLEWVQINGYPKRSPITVSFSELGFRCKAPGDFIGEEVDDALDTLYKRSVKQEHTQLIQLQYVFQGLSAVAYNSYRPCCAADFPQDRSEQLKGIIRNYFQNDYPKDLKLEIEASNVPDEHIIDDVNGLLNMYPDNSFSGRNVARIFHGITSPNYPAVMWGRCKYWRANSKIDFNRIIQLANAVIVKRRS